jgi:hypothetical protein
MEGWFEFRVYPHPRHDEKSADVIESAKLARLPSSERVRKSMKTKHLNRSTGVCSGEGFVRLTYAAPPPPYAFCKNLIRQGLAGGGVLRI